MKAPSAMRTEKTRTVVVSNNSKPWVWRLTLVFCLAGSFCGPTFGEEVYSGKTYGLTSSLGFGDWQPWDVAEDISQLFGGHLATIDNLELNNWLAQTFSSSTDSALIGLSYSTPGGSWKWASTNSTAPDYRHWAPGYPNQSSLPPYAAYLQMSDGLWRDTTFPMIGIYQVDHASVVPITMDLPLCSIANDVSSTGTDHVLALGSGSTIAEIRCSDGNWGGRIESGIQFADQGAAEVYVGDLTGPQSGTLTIGASAEIPLGTPLNLAFDANILDLHNQSSTWNLTIKRDHDTILSMNTPQEIQIPVYAGETLSVDYSDSLSTKGVSSLAINLWAVPEPATLSLLVVLGFCVLGYVWRQKKPPR
jgi:hypothetical protein